MKRFGFVNLRVIYQIMALTYGENAMRYAILSG